MATKRPQLDQCRSFRTSFKGHSLIIFIHCDSKRNLQCFQLNEKKHAFRSFKGKITLDRKCLALRINGRHFFTSVILHNQDISVIRNGKRSHARYQFSPMYCNLPQSKHGSFRKHHATYVRKHMTATKHSRFPPICLTHEGFPASTCHVGANCCQVCLQ